MNETVKDMWLSYARAVLPPGVFDVRRQEMRKSFMAGAWAMLDAAYQELADEPISERAFVQLEAWREEIRRFHKDILEGRV